MRYFVFGLAEQLQENDDNRDDCEQEQQQVVLVVFSHLIPFRIT